MHRKEVMVFTMRKRARERQRVNHNLLKRLFRGETLEGYIEAARVKTLDSWS